MKTNLKRYLIDTHILIWWLTDDPQLSKTAREILSNPKNHIVVSVVSAWEMNIKLTVNKQFRMSVSLEECFNTAGFDIVPITLEHVLTLQSLPYLHKDPFDRMLISQALCENLTLISMDKKIQQYPEIMVVGADAVVGSGSI